MSLIASLALALFCLAPAFAAAPKAAQPALNESELAALAADLNGRGAEIGAAQAKLKAAGPKAIEPVLRAMGASRLKGRFMPVVIGIGPVGIPKLIELLGNPDLQGPAGQALLAVSSPRAAAHIPALIACAKKGGAYKPCGQALAQACSPEAGARVSAISALLKDRDPELRTNAAVALALIGKPAASASPALAKALQDDAASVRWSSARALGAIGRVTPEQAAALKRAMNDSDGTVRSEAARAVKKITVVTEAKNSNGKRG